MKLSQGRGTSGTPCFIIDFSLVGRGLAGQVVPLILGLRTAPLITYCSVLPYPWVSFQPSALGRYGLRQRYL